VRTALSSFLVLVVRQAMLVSVVSWSALFVSRVTPSSFLVAVVRQAVLGCSGGLGVRELEVVLSSF